MPRCSGGGGIQQAKRFNEYRIVSCDRLIVDESAGNSPVDSRSLMFIRRYGQVLVQVDHLHPGSLYKSYHLVSDQAKEKMTLQFFFAHLKPTSRHSKDFHHWAMVITLFSHTLSGSNDCYEG